MIRNIQGALVAVEPHGLVSLDLAEQVLSALSRVYGEAEPPRYVEVHLYGLSRDYEAVNGSAPMYPAMHEAYLGYPRIHIVQSLVPRAGDEAEAVLIHEAVHSLLHGSPDYYRVEVDLNLLERYGGLADVFTHAASTVKDLDVALFQRSHGMLGELWSYAKYLLSSSVGEVVEAAILSTGMLGARERRVFLVLLSKRIAPLVFLLDAECCSAEAFRLLGSYLDSYPSWVGSSANRLLREVLPRLRGEGLSARVNELLASIAFMVGGDDVG